MNDLQMRVFLIAAKYLNISKAAKECFMSQQAVSRHIRTLESELGFELFYRSGNRISLTPAGKDCTRAFTSFRQNMSSIKRRYNADEPQPYLVRYSCYPVWVISDILQTNEAYIKNRHKDWDIQYVYCNADDLVENLIEGNLDVVILGEEEFENIDNITTVPLIRIQEGILYSDNHPLAEREDLTPGDFRDSVLLYNLNPLMSEVFLNKFCATMEHEYGFMPVIQSTKDVDSMLLKIEAGKGIMFVDQWMRPGTTRGMHWIATKLMNQVVLAFRSDDINPVVREFVRESQMFFHTHAEEILSSG